MSLLVCRSFAPIIFDFLKPNVRRARSIQTILFDNKAGIANCALQFSFIMANPSGTTTWRGNLFNRESPSPSPGSPKGSARPRSAIMSSPLSASHSPGHIRNHSLSAIPLALAAQHNRPNRPRTNSKPSSASITNTFAPKFIQAEDSRKSTENIRTIEGENDFSGKRYVWVKDVENAFVRGWVVSETEIGQLLVQCDDGSVC